jgi:membrane-associated protease RseP (regulator of RpoE activity)
MNKQFWMLAAAAILGFSALSSHKLSAQTLPEPTLDERFQNPAEVAPEGALPPPKSSTSTLPTPTEPLPRLSAPGSSANERPSRVGAGPAYLGVTFEPRHHDAAVVQSVRSGSPAEKAGLQPGDVIERLNGQQINSNQDAVDLVGSMRSGETLSIDFSRRMTVRTQASLDRLPATGGHRADYPPDAADVSPTIQQGPQMNHELLPTPANAKASTVAPQQRNYANPARPNQTGAAANGNRSNVNQQGNQRGRDRSNGDRGRIFRRR